MTWPKRKLTEERFHASPRLGNRLRGIVKLLRQNHAMEHATISLLLKRLDRKVRFLGYATPTGFVIVGDIPTEMLKQSIDEALSQLQAGKEHLAISPMCGTNLVVAGLAACLASTISGRGYSGWGRFSRMATASMIAVLVAQPLGALAQRHVTTDSGQDNVTSFRVTRKGAGFIAQHKVTILRS